MIAHRHADLTANDVMLASYPRSGSNWLTLMLGELLAGYDVDFETDPQPIPFVGAQRGSEPVLPGGGRLIKTHERFRPEYRRGIYITRHPAEVLLSYHHQLTFAAYPGIELNRFLRAWVRGTVDGYGSWSENVISWLDAPAPVYVIRFERLLRDTATVLEEILEFLGISRPPAAIQTAVANNELERMRRKQLALIRLMFGKELEPPPTTVGTAETIDRVLGEDELALLERACRPGLERLGYGLPSKVIRTP